MSSPVSEPRIAELAGYDDPTDETGYFLILGLVAIAVGVLVLVATKPVSRLMQGVH
jgi:POT family proton-dependent oligopeptide transporter